MRYVRVSHPPKNVEPIGGREATGINPTGRRPLSWRLPLVYPRMETDHRVTLLLGEREAQKRLS
jgi:hypothetical protein